tara:strand:- start:301 stop:888 length:588 start_codon:yes stop_codon:yes gene_type:complete
MFSGIIEKIGHVDSFEVTSVKSHLVLEIDLSDTNLCLGDSVAVNGVCLTVVKVSDNKCHFDISPETLSLTMLKDLRLTHQVNIEFPLTLNKFISGHITTGHVDSLGTIKSILQVSDAWKVCLELDQSILKFIIHKGSIAIDGVSLTINKISDNVIDLMIIPHTYKNTIFKNYKIGQKVNIEVDYITKHLEKLKND